MKSKVTKRRGGKASETVRQPRRPGRIVRLGLGGANKALEVGSATSALDIKGFCRRFHLVRPDVTRMTGYSLRVVDKWASGHKPGVPAQKQLKELVRLFDALAEIMEPKYVGEWLKTPNDAFDGSTPLQVIERGETDRIWHMIYVIETGEPL